MTIHLDPNDADDITWFAELLHDEYERAAQKAGWSTQDGTSTAFDDLPEENKETMIRLSSWLLYSMNVTVDAKHLQMDYGGELGGD